MLTLTVLLLPLFSVVAARNRHSHDHSHGVAKRLPDAWYHPDDHPVHALFKRGGATDGLTYPAVGSNEWTQAYPAGPPNSPKTVPAEWTAALNDAIARKAIPDIPVAQANGDNNPSYPGHDPNSPEICSATYKCRIPGDIWDAPDGYLGISFDDGPEQGSDALLTFLSTNKQPVTHFMIGSNIVFMPDQFTKAFNMGNDIAVHTWTHPHMTTRTNEEVLGELGWTIEIIHNSTGGRVPKYWRPPYGDSDVRTTAIAREVFGLTTIIWNQDTGDWSLTAKGGTTPQAINSSMTQWLTGSKSPGLIILEHELSTESVASFVAAYPIMQQNNWKLASLAQLMGGNASYQNAANNLSPVNPANNILGAKSAPAPVASSTTKSAGPPNSAKVAAQQTSAKGSPSTSANTPNKSSAAAPSWAKPPMGLLSAIAFLSLF
ncbi:carbohydrate esterase family 4 protein [Mycena belliarum]|uniref:chitin deacetylase n=1 Tax=Mycena belliarum TaxID=1033014 RepID=A0AAD6TZK6_9AGAR|nr:carbohydrate esterase family 4 protein [Mycena belliae]